MGSLNCKPSRRSVNADSETKAKMSAKKRNKKCLLDILKLRALFGKKNRQTTLIITTTPSETVVNI